MFMKFWPRNLNIPFMRYRYVGVAFSLLMVIGSCYLLATRGLKLGVDFAGGTVLELASNDRVNESTLRASGIPGTEGVNTATIADGQEIVVVRFGNVDAALQSPEFLALSEEDQIAQAPAASKIFVMEALKKKYGLKDADFLRQDTVGPKVSQELFRDGILALGVAILLMLAFVAVRYQWQYGIGGIVALVHDAIGTLGLFSLFQIEFNLTTIAALLTIIGYSINDTVVVFDRVREDRRKYKTMPATQLIDLATNETLSRTFLTATTTILAIAAIVAFGGPVLQGMSIAMIWGIFIGTYSSIFVASAIVLWFGLGFEGGEKKKVEGFQLPQN